MVELHEWVEVINIFWLVGCFNEAGGGNAAIIRDHGSWDEPHTEADLCKALECLVVELDGPNPPISMLKAWAGMVLLAEDIGATHLLVPPL